MEIYLSFRHIAMLIIVAALLSSGLGGLVAFVLSQIIPEEQLSHAGKEIFALNSIPNIFIGIVILAPPIETLISQAIPIELIRRITTKKIAPICFSAGVFSFGHFLNGGLAHGLATLGTGIILSGLYLILRKNGAILSCLAVTFAHSLHNFFALIMAYSFHY